MVDTFLETESQADRPLLLSGGVGCALRKCWPEQTFCLPWGSSVHLGVQSGVSFPHSPLVISVSSALSEESCLSLGCLKKAAFLLAV